MNKRLIVLFVCLILIVTIIVLNSTVFVVTDIKIASKDEDWYDYDKIIQSSNLKNRQNIFFLNEKNLKQNIEKSNSYVRVNSVERQFPNKLTLHISLRIPILAVKVSGQEKYFITDWEMNVVDIADSNSNLVKKSTIVSGYSFVTNKELSEYKGENLSDTKVNFIKEISKSAGNLKIADVAFRVFFKGIDLSKTPYVYIKTNSGVTFILISNIDQSLEKQLSYIYSLYVGLPDNSVKRNSGFYKIDTEKGAWIWNEKDS